MHAAMHNYLQTLNGYYGAHRELWEEDCDWKGFQWISCDDCDNSVIAFYRLAKDGKAMTLVVCNFTPVVRHHYRIGAPRPGVYQEVLNSDATEFGGSGILNAGDLTTEAIPMHGRPQSLELTLPPLGTIYLQLVKEGDSHENPEDKKDPRPAEAGEAGSGH